MQKDKRQPEEPRRPDKTTASERNEEEVRRPFDSSWLDQLPKEDGAYRPWWVIEDPWSKTSRSQS